MNKLLKEKENLLYKATEKSSEELKRASYILHIMCIQIVICMILLILMTSLLLIHDMITIASIITVFILALVLMLLMLAIKHIEFIINRALKLKCIE